MPRFIANADYEEKDRDPIRLRVGDRVEAGPADRAWPGWVWVRDDAGRSGYVPEEILRPVDDGTRELTEDFDPTVLAVSRGDALESLRQIDGWHWCRNAAGATGWVAGYLLRPA